MQGDEPIVIVALLQGHIAAQDTLLAVRDATIRDLRVELERKAFELARSCRRSSATGASASIPRRSCCPAWTSPPATTPPPEEPVASSSRQAMRDVVSRSPSRPPRARTPRV